MVAAVADDELTAEDVQAPQDVDRLGGLERYRLQFMDTEQGSVTSGSGVHRSYISTKGEEM